MAIPTPVVVVEPKRSQMALTVRFTSQILVLFAVAWFIMLLAPVAFHYHAGYWQCFAALLVARFLQKSPGLPKIEDLETQKEEGK